MSRSGYDTFALVINFINPSQVPCHIIVGLFEAPDIFSVVLVEQVKVLLAEFNLTNKVIMYVKDERTNLNSVTITFIYVISCEPLQLFQPFAGFYFGHVVPKACQYAMNEINVGVGMKEVNLKDAQAAFQKTITQTKKSGKGTLEWEKACHEGGM